MKEIIKEIIEFDLDEGRMDYLDDMIDVFSKDGCEMVDILFDRFLKKYYADIDVSNERMTINLTDEEGHVLSFSSRNTPRNGRESAERCGPRSEGR